MNRLVLALSTTSLIAHVGACGDTTTATPDAARNTTIDANLQPQDAAPTSNDASPVDATPADAATTDASGTDASPVAGVVINEFLMDQDGNDSDEFVELKGEANTDYSSLSLLQVDGDDVAGLNPGRILTVHSGCTTDSSGYCVIDVNANTLQNGTQTLLLVRGRAPFLNEDVDTDDDGILDNEPWDELLDSVAVFDNTPAVDNLDKTYAGSAVLNKVVSNGEPTAFGGASRIPDEIDTDTAADWTSNTPQFDNSGVQPSEALNTPGQENSLGGATN